MDVFEAIKNRRSIRGFQRKPVSEEQVKRLVEAAISAPSAGNIQPWEFIIVRDPDIKQKLSLAALDQNFIAEAPVVIAVCADKTRSSQRYGERGANLYCLQDTAAAIQNMLLAAHAMELGTCWVGAFKEDMASKALKTPSNVRPIAIIPVGYPTEKPASRRKRTFEEVIHQETF